jgi:hypothetical protein
LTLVLQQNNTLTIRDHVYVPTCRAASRASCWLAGVLILSVP